MLLMLSDLTADRVSAWLEQENTRRPTRAALAYRLMRAFIRWAAGMPEYQTAAHLEAVGSRVARDHLHRVKAKEGDCFQREQLPAWFKAVRELSNPVQAAYLQALLLTGTRREELLIDEKKLEGIHFFRRALVQQRVEEETAELVARNQELSLAQYILDSLPCAVLGLAADGSIVRSNRKGDEFFAAGLPTELVELAATVSALGELRREVAAGGRNFLVRGSRMRTEDGQPGVILVMDEV